MPHYFKFIINIEAAGKMRGRKALAK